MKVIFLDFDGVIAIPPTWCIDINKLKNLKNIVDKTQAKIVVSSSWRCENIEKTKEFWFNKIKRNNKNHMLNWFIDNLYDVTGVYCDRGTEIQQYINTHDVENYVILDDDDDILNSQIYHFVQTNFEFGLTETEMSLTIKILNNERIYNKIGLNYKLRYAWLLKCDGNNTLNNELEKYYK